jgi:hypothetical protein
MVIILLHPVDRIAGQSVPAGERRYVTVFYPAQPALGCRPERTIAVKLKAGDKTLTKPIRGCVRFAYVTLSEMSYAAVEPEAKPNSSLPRIGDLNGRKLLTPEFRPRGLLD